MTLVYLTYFETMSGVYEGQVIDVCDYIEKTFNVPTRLIAVLSPRDYPRQSARLLARAHQAQTICAPLGWRGWPLARAIVKWQVAAALPNDASAILARGPLAAAYAQYLRNQGRIHAIGYDGRGAISAEWSEYEVAPSLAWKNRIETLERDAVVSSDTRVAISSQLVMHWQKVFGYDGNRHVVIPCTLSDYHVGPLPDVEQIARRRAELGFLPGQTIICYAGSAAEWQSFAALDPWLDALLTKDPNVALLLMTRANLSETMVIRNHADRIRQVWVTPEQVRETMTVADFGLLVRASTITNRVAAPTKFAEYLAAGLKVLISRDLGDYSQLVEDHNLGIQCDIDGRPPVVVQTNSSERVRLSNFALGRFSKGTFEGSYRRLLLELGCVKTGRPTFQGCADQEGAEQS